MAYGLLPPVFSVANCDFGIEHVKRKAKSEKGNRKMIDRIDTHPTTVNDKYIEKRSGDERRKIFTMLDPDIDRRKGERRKRSRKNRYLS